MSQFLCRHSIVGVPREFAYRRGWTSSSDSEPLDSSSDGGEPSISRRPKEADQPWSYMFEPEERVWVKAGTRWFYGIVIRPAPYQLDPSRRLRKASWVVEYERDMQGTFAPLDGVIKPDTCHMRNLLRELGLKPTQMAKVHE